MVYDPIRRPVCVATINGTPVPGTVVTLTCHRSPHLAASWNMKQKRVVTAQALGTTTRAGAGPPRTQGRLQGTGTGWDQLYVINHIHRRMSFSEGFTMPVEATAGSLQSMAGWRPVGPTV